MSMSKFCADGTYKPGIKYSMGDTLAEFKKESKKTLGNFEDRMKVLETLLCQQITGDF